MKDKKEKKMDIEKIKEKFGIIDEGDIVSEEDLEGDTDE